MPDKHNHQLFVQLGAVRIAAIGLPAIIATVVITLIAFSRLSGTW
jgi:hypothetical protein